MFPRASQAEVIRANQKDEYYTSFIRSSLANIVQDTWGMQNNH